MFIQRATAATTRNVMRKTTQYTQQRMMMQTTTHPRFQQPIHTNVFTTTINNHRHQTTVLSATALGGATAAVCPVNHDAMKTINKYKYDIQPDDKYYQNVAKNEAAIRAAIEKVAEDEDYDGLGSYLPLFIRLAWHSSGTFDVETKTGGSQGGCIRFRGTENDEGRHGANNGLDLAIQRLQPVKEQFPFLSYADLFTFAGVVAAEALSDHKIKVPYAFGRYDYTEGSHYTVDRVRLPDATKDEKHVREVFTKQMGFNDREIVALLGAHAVGKVHPDRSGFGSTDLQPGENPEALPWTFTPLSLDTNYYRTLLNEKWSLYKNQSGAYQYENEGRNLVMLPAEYVLVTDPKFKQYVDLYAKDEAVWQKDFASAFGKLLALGVDTKQ